MRDILFTLLMGYGMFQAFRQPWIGALLWVGIGLMNPHRFTYGFAFDVPWSMLVAGVTLLGLLVTKDRASPFRQSWAPALILAFTVWVTISWLNGRFVAEEMPMWSRALKTFAMLLVCMALLFKRRHIMLLVWTVALSIAPLGAKGGLFTILTGGSYRVYGPPDSWVADNNAFAVALIVVIPLMRFLQMQLDKAWQKQVMGAAALLCTAAALGSQSRGALLAISAMALLLWWRGRNRLKGGVVILAVAVALVSFMPDSWFERMNTIKTYEEDGSAQGRLSAWKVAIGLANDYFTGVGFSTGLSEYFYKYANVQHGGVVAHSIYFEVLGQHGYVGLAIFLAIGISAWRAAAQVRKKAAKIPEAQWCVQLAGMCQVSLLGYAVGGAFLTLAFYDLPYYVLAIAVLTRQWVERRGWETDDLPMWRWPRGGMQSASPAAVARGNGHVA